MVTQDSIREAYALIDTCARTREGDVSDLFAHVGVEQEDIALAIALALQSGVFLLEPNSFGLGFMVGLLASGTAPMQVEPLTDGEIDRLLGPPGPQS